MSALTFLLICFQACLVHHVLAAIGPLGYAGAPGACGCGAGFQGPYGVAPIGALEPTLEGFGYGAGYLGRGFGLAGPFAGFEAGYPGYLGLEGYAAYGGAGVGNCAVAGELPVGGSTVVAGQVPIMGAVEYGGFVPAAGAVTIAGNCACGCGGPYAY